MNQSNPERNKSTKNQENDAEAAIKALRRFGNACLFVLLAAIGGWSTLASLQGAVIAPGTVTVKANIKRVQHLDGGVISEILIAEGDEVKKGDVLIRLETTRDSANLAALDSNLDELTARRARLIAERDQLTSISLQKNLGERAANQPRIKEIIAGQISIFKARRATLEDQINRMKGRITELGEVVKGLRAQLIAKKRQSELINAEFTDLSSLKEKGLVPQSRLLALQREMARLEGEQGELGANTARTKLQISETELEILRIKKENHSKILSELAEVSTKVNQLNEQRTTLNDKLKHKDIRAPRSGLVHNLAVHTIGGVITPGADIMMIVPKHAELIVAAKVNPADIDQVYKGQTAKVRLNAFDQRTTPEIDGKVTHVSGDSLRLDPDAPPFYSVHLSLDRSEKTALNHKRLMPGMQTEVYIQTKNRAVFEYLLQPLTDQIRRAMREP